MSAGRGQPAFIFAQGAFALAAPNHLRDCCLDITWPQTK